MPMLLPLFTLRSPQRRRRQKTANFPLNYQTDSTKARLNNGSQSREDDAGVRIR
jgi:hypothetical protein